MHKEILITGQLKFINDVAAANFMFYYILQFILAHYRQNAQNQMHFIMKCTTE